MIEDILENYRRKCTRTGQFDFVLDTWLLIFIFFGIGGIFQKLCGVSSFWDILVWNSDCYRDGQVV